MITYTELTRYPQAAPSLIGITPSALDALYERFEVARMERLHAARLTR